MGAYQMREQTLTNATAIDFSIYNQEVQERINQLIEDNFDVEDIVSFVDQYGMNNINYYEDIVQLCEDYSRDAVEEFLEEFDFSDLNYFADMYAGQYNTLRDYAEQLFDDIYLNEIPEHLQRFVDYDAFTTELSYEFLITESGHVFNRNY